MTSEACKAVAMRWPYVRWLAFPVSYAVDIGLREWNMDNKKRGVLIVAMLLALVLVVAGVAYRMLGANHGDGDVAPYVNDTADSTNTSDASSPSDAPMLSDYDATVYTELGEPVLLSDIADGKPLVVNFWATWCPYCVEEMDDYQRLYHLYGQRVAFAFVDCNYQRGETAEKAALWLQDNGYGDLPAYYDTNADATSSFGVRSYPTSIVVAADGEIVSAFSGTIDFGKMDTLLTSLVD